MEKKKFKIPHVYVIVICLILLAAILTYIVPAGSYSYIYDEASGRDIVDPNSFSYLQENNPTSFTELITAIPVGCAAAVETMMMVLLICASVQIVSDTGAMNAGIFALLKVMKGQKYLVITIMTILFGLIGAILGWAEGLFIFIPLIVTMTVAMGYDNILGYMIIAVGGGIGFSTGPMNVYTTGVCQGIVGLPLFSGMGFRWAIWAIFMAVGIFFVLAYAKKLDKDIKNSAIYGVEGIIKPDVSVIPEFTTRRKLVFVIFLGGVVLSAFGCVKWGWYLQELSGVFVLTGILCGIAYGMGGTEMANSFANGLKGVIPSTMIIGAARGILYLMESASILHTLIHGVAIILGNFSPVTSAIGINIVTLIFNFFITSATAKASILMPILAPLGDILGISQQVVVVAYQLGDGFTNYFWPTSSDIMAGLAIAGCIPWEKWAKTIWKFILTMTIMSWCAIAVAHMIGLS